MLALPPGSRAHDGRARVSFLSTAVQKVLEQGPFCAVASSTPRGPHCTPLVFAYSGGRIWLTTSRVGQDAGVEARSERGRAGASRRARGHVHRHREDVRRARPEHMGRRGGGRDVDRARHGAGSAGRTRGSSRATRSTRSRCRSPGRRRGACSSASSSSGRRCSTRTGCRRGAVGGAARRSRTGRSARARATRRPLGPASDVRERARGARAMATLTLARERGPGRACRRVASGRRRRCTRRCRPRRSRSPMPGPTRRSRSRWTARRRGAPGTWSAPWCRARLVLRARRARLGREDRARAGHVDRSGGRRARPHRARAVVWWKGWTSGSSRSR